MRDRAMQHAGGSCYGNGSAATHPSPPKQEPLRTRDERVYCMYTYLYCTYRIHRQTVSIAFATPRGWGVIKT